MGFQSMTFEAQAPICPFCCDDHSSTRGCKTLDLQVELIQVHVKNLLNLLKANSETLGHPTNQNMMDEIKAVEMKLKWLKPD